MKKLKITCALHSEMPHNLLYLENVGSLRDTGNLLRLLPARPYFLYNSDFFKKMLLSHLFNTYSSNLGSSNLTHLRHRKYTQIVLIM